MGLRKSLISFFCVIAAIAAFSVVFPDEKHSLRAADLSEIDAPVDEQLPPPQNAAAPAAPAQNTPAKAPPKEKNYLVWMFQSLGWVFAPLFLVMSIVMVALFVINILAIRRNVLHPDDLVEQFKTLLDEKKFQEAYEFAKENDSLLARVLAAGLAKMSRGYEQAVQAMQDVGEEETMKLESRLNHLALLGNIAPMLGLFGTVVGMIASFNTIASSITTPPAYELAEGIATALFTTEIGLAIAIPSIAGYDIMKNMLARYTLEIGITSDNLMSRFKK